jgi:hypothetical protein
MGGKKFPLKHKAFAKRFRSRGVGDGVKVGRVGRCECRMPQPGIFTIFSFAYLAGRIDSEK